MKSGSILILEKSDLLETSKSKAITDLKPNDFQPTCVTPKKLDFYYVVMYIEGTVSIVFKNKFSKSVGLVKAVTSVIHKKEGT